MTDLSVRKQVFLFFWGGGGGGGEGRVGGEGGHNGCIDASVNKM